MRLIWLLMLTLPLSCAIEAYAQDEGNCSKPDPSTRPDCPRAKAFFTQLQIALSKDDRNAVAAMIDYPLRTTIQDRTVLIRNPSSLIARFQEVFSAHVRCTISRAKVTDVWGNWQGFTIKEGTIWFDGVVPQGATVNTSDRMYWNKYPLKIKTVNHGATNDGCE